MTPLGLDASAMVDALEQYRYRCRTLAVAFTTERSDARFAPDVLSRLDDLVTMIEVDAAARDLPEGRQRMSLLESRIFKPFLDRLQAETARIPLDAPCPRWLAHLESAEKLVGEAVAAISASTRRPNARLNGTDDRDRAR